MDKYWGNPLTESASQKYDYDPHFRVLVDTMTAMLWHGDYGYSELRQASILAAMRIEAMRIRPLIFDPSNYTIEQGVLGSRPGLETE